MGVKVKIISVKFMRFENVKKGTFFNYNEKMLSNAVEDVVV